MSGDIGRASIRPADDVIVDTAGTWEIVFTAGEAGLPRFGGFRVYVPPGWSLPQFDRPTGQGYVRFVAETSEEVEFEPYIYSARWISLEVKRGKVLCGDRIRVIYGDKTKGGLGALAPRVPVPRSEFTVSVDVEGYYNYVKLPESPFLRVIPGRAQAISVVVPSLVEAGQEFDVHLKVVDNGQNVTLTEPCQIQIRVAPGKEDTSAGSVPLNHEFVTTRVKVREVGTFFVEAKTDNGELRGKSNPVRVLPTRPKFAIYWGDIHGHSLCSDGRFSPEEYYRYARDVSRLDFCALTDHDDVGSNSNVEDHSKLMSLETWNYIKEVTNRFNEPHRFTTLVAYEYTQREIELGGHRNVYFASDDPPIFRCWDAKTNTPTKLFQALRELNERVIVIPHHALRFMSREHDPLLQRLFEVYSMWGSSEHPEDDCAFTHPVKYHRGGLSFRDCLARGYKMGVVASGDNHDSLPGLRQATDIWRKGRMAQPPGLVAVYAAENTRESIFDALWNRRCYATTGQRIVLEVNVNDTMMGQDVYVPEPGAPREISVSVTGEDVIAKVEIIKNGTVLCSRRGDNANVTLHYVDTTSLSGTGDYYYAKVTQVDGARAWSSPIWVYISEREEQR